MLAIISTDKDARALLDSLKLENVSGSAAASVRQSMLMKHNIELNEEQFKFAVDAMHRAFHYHVTIWLQDQGFSIQRIG